MLYHFIEGDCNNTRYINGRHVKYHIQYILQLSIVLRSELHLYGIKLIKCHVSDGQLLFSTISICYIPPTLNHMKLQFWNDFSCKCKCLKMKCDTMVWQLGTWIAYR
jgi:hypothetical protein